MGSVRSNARIAGDWHAGTAGHGAGGTDIGPLTVRFIAANANIEAPAIRIDRDDAAGPRRPAGQGRFAVLVGLSLSLHGALYALAALQQPEAMSLGETSIAVEIVIGSQVNAGLAATPSESEAPQSAAVDPAERERKVGEDSTAPPREESRPPERDVTLPEPPKEVVRVEPSPDEPTSTVPRDPLPQEPPDAVLDRRQEKPAQDLDPPKQVAQAAPPRVGPAVEEIPQEDAAPATMEPAAGVAPQSSPRDEPTSRQEVSDHVRPPEQMAARPDKPSEMPLRADNASPQKALERKPDPPTRTERRNRSSATAAARSSAPANASSGLGRGRSESEVSYQGRIVAHLARHKRYPGEARARREEGTGIVRFSISGTGQVTAVTVARASGSTALDREIAAMVRRASPFPPPPGGAARTFSAPVSFRLD